VKVLATGQAINWPRCHPGAEPATTMTRSSAGFASGSNGRTRRGRL